MRVLLVVIDAASPHVVCPAIRTGRLPVLARLADAGELHDRSVSIFPSITPAATTTIVTGAYPAEHGIAGASWFDEAREEIAYYGDDFWVIARQGFGHFLRDFLLRLNGDRLRAPTLFEMVERRGRRAAAINYLVFRGEHTHRVRVPRPIAALPGVPVSETVAGPTILDLGDFTGPRAHHGRAARETHGFLHRFGMDDEATGALLCDLLAHEQPDLTVAYFADNDFRSHDVGPFAALPVIEQVDRMLGDAFEAAGGVDRVLEHTCVIVTSDHGHCDIRRDAGRAAVPLDHVLGNFRQARLGRGWRAHDDLLICPNMRAAQIYLRHPTPVLIERVVADLLAHPGVDQVLWRRAHGGHRDAGYMVASRHGRLQFGRAGGEPDALADPFGGRWRCTGEAAVLALDLDGGRVGSDIYPNPFERIAGVLDLDRSGELWVTASPGCEFDVRGGSPHVGGASHGALHALDSYSPLLIAGHMRPALPRWMRLVDIAPLCMQALGLPMRYAPGESRRAPCACTT